MDLALRGKNSDSSEAGGNVVSLHERGGGGAGRGRMIRGRARKGREGKNPAPSPNHRPRQGKQDRRSAQRIRTREGKGGTCRRGKEEHVVGKRNA